MTKEQYNQFKMNNSVSSLNSNSGDKVQDLMKEVYYEGFCEGYEYAIGRLQLIGPSIFGCRFDDYFGKYMPKIRARLDAIRELEETEKTEGETGDGSVFH